MIDRSQLTALVFAALAAGAPRAHAQSAAASPLKTMSDELARNFTALKSQPTPAYFLSYEITDTRSATVSSAFGALSNSGENHHRQVSITLRVGSYAFDNTHPVRGSFARADALLDRFSSSAPIPVDDDPAAIRNVLWLQTDRRYKTALQQLAGARTNARVAVAAEDNSGDYSAAPVMSYSEPVAPFQVDRAAWEKRLRSYTAPFARYGDIYDAVASLEAKVETRWYVNSEGTQVQVSEPAYRIVVVARSKADDGMELPRYETFYASSLAGLPGDNTILDAVGRMITDLHALRVAPVVDPYTGPAILSGRAAAVFFHEVFGHRVEGQRQKGEDEAQTFKKRINERVLPENFSVVFDPTARRLGSVELMGSYRYDDEGVAARPVTIVQNGTLKSFLMSRTPIDGIPVSNGHGRAQVGLAPVARQSNLIVQVSHPVSHDDLKKMLIDEIKKENKPFGLLFDDIEGGFTITQRFIPNAFNVLPVMVYRVFPDGRQELVRGVDLIGTPLTTFSKIAAADNDVATFNGICGAESGAVPVSASSPGLFISQVEVQKKIKSQESPPILPAPLVEPAAPSNDALVRAMRDELARSIQRLRLDTLPRPYFISYRVTESKGRNALAHLGSLQGTSESGGGRLFQVEVHVGDYAFDNTNYFGAGFLPQAFVGLSPLVEDDDYQEMRRQMWVATDRAYKQALEAVAQKRAALETRTRTDSVADFSKEPVTNTADDVPPPATTDRKPLEALARELSAAFRQSPEIYNSTVGVQEFWSRDTYLNSEGTFFTRSRIHAAVNVSASTQALDGTAQSMAYSVLADSFRALPGKDSLLKGVKDLATRLAAQRRVPVADAYDGPMLFEGKAAAELFNAMIASKLVGSRRPVTSPMFASLVARSGGGEEWEDLIGTLVLPRWMSVVDDPTLRVMDGRPTDSYRVDEEGVTTHATTVVDHGVLKTLLTSRVPVIGVDHSTGNRFGRGARPLHMTVTVDSALSDAEMHAKLLALASAAGRDYGIIVRLLAAGATGDPESALLPQRAAGGASARGMELVKVFADGHEEPVRGAEIFGLTASSFKTLVAASRSRTVANLGFAGGGSPFAGGVGTGAVMYDVPSFLFGNVTIRKSRGNTPSLPVVPPPPR